MSEDEGLSKKSQCERQLCLEFIRRFSAGSWRVLGTFSAESRQDLSEISLPLAIRSLGRPKTAPRKPKGSQRVPKDAKREPKGSQRKPQGRPKGAQGEAKSIKNQGFSWHGFRKAKKRVARFTFARFWLHFGSMLTPFWVPFRSQSRSESLLGALGTPLENDSDFESPSRGAPAAVAAAPA